MTREATERLPGLLGHELRNPLASAMTGAMLARELVDATDPRATVLDGVLHDLDRMTGLIDGWLRVAADGTPAEDSADLEDVLQKAAERQRIEVLAVPPSVQVRGDALLLERVIENLAENARNAGATRVRVAAQQEGDEVHVHVEDNGRGVDPADAEHIFEAGWSGGGGNGLGLYAAAETLAACDGGIDCVQLPKGTRFTVTLRRAAGPMR